MIDYAVQDSKKTVTYTTNTFFLLPRNLYKKAAYDMNYLILLNVALHIYNLVLTIEIIAGPEGSGRKNFKIWTQETDGPNYCYAVYTFPMGYKSLVA
jgi:hypothetical protein